MADDATNTQLAPKKGRPRGIYDHGSLPSYTQGCRCQPCKDAHAQRCRENKARRMVIPGGADRAGHGKASTYANYGCRCRPCTDANSAACVAYKRARRQKEGTVQ